MVRSNLNDPYARFAKIKRKRNPRCMCREVWELFLSSRGSAVRNGAFVKNVFYLRLQSELRINI